MTYYFVQSVKQSRLSGSVRHHHFCSKKCLGFTLIEVLVAMVMMGIALLGLSGLMSTGIGQNQKALNDSQILILLEDMSNRMRSNREAALSGAYNVSRLKTTQYTAPINTPDCMTQACNEGDLAAFDINQWMFQLFTLLNPLDPDSIEVTICRILASEEGVITAKSSEEIAALCVADNSASNAISTISVTWGGDVRTQQSLSMSVAL